MDKLLTADEVAAHLGFAVKTIHNWVSQGRIPHLKIGGRLRFENAAISEWKKQFAGAVMASDRGLAS